MLTRQTIRSLERKLNKAIGEKQKAMEKKGRIFIRHDYQKGTYALYGRTYNSLKELKANEKLDPQIEYCYIIFYPPKDKT